MMDEEVLITDKTMVEEITDRLKEAILDSDVYKRYTKIYDEIKADEGLLRQVNELRRNNFFAQNGGSGRMSYDEYHNVYNATRQLRQNSLVNDFLDAELDLARMMQHINEEIMEAIKFDCNFL